MAEQTIGGHEPALLEGHRSNVFVGDTVQSRADGGPFLRNTEGNRETDRRGQEREREGTEESSLRSGAKRRTKLAN